jgi:hypothetical protein
MSATATRPANNALDQRRLGIAMAAAILAVGLLVAATVSRQLTVPTTPAAPAPVAAAHDHGWATSSSAEKGFVYTGIPYTPSRSLPQTRPLNPGEIMVNNAQSDGLAGSGPRERFAR